MNPGRFFIPNMNATPFMPFSVSPVMGSKMAIPQGTNIFRRIMDGLKSVNWSKMLGGANKTLNVMNQTIPLIRQAKPMIGNVKSMFQLARAFSKETGKEIYRHNNNKNGLNINNDVKLDKQININNELPTFFI